MLKTILLAALGLAIASSADAFVDEPGYTLRVHVVANATCLPARTQYEMTRLEPNKRYRNEDACREAGDDWLFMMRYFFTPALSWECGGRIWYVCDEPAAGS